jgi:hypothetical protein
MVRRSSMPPLPVSIFERPLLNNLLPSIADPTVSISDVVPHNWVLDNDCTDKNCPIHPVYSHGSLSVGCFWFSTDCKPRVSDSADESDGNLCDGCGPFGFLILMNSGHVGGMRGRSGRELLLS